MSPYDNFSILITQIQINGITIENNSLHVNDRLFHEYSVAVQKRHSDPS